MANPLAESLNRLIHEPAPLRNKIINSLRRAIETGALEPGTRLVEKDLCEKLNLSRAQGAPEPEHLGNRCNRHRDRQPPQGGSRKARRHSAFAAFSTVYDAS